MGKTNTVLLKCKIFSIGPIPKQSQQFKKSMILPKRPSSYSLGILVFIGLINISNTAFAGMFSGDYNPYMGLSPFEQCMIYLGGDENIEEELNEDLYGCGEKWGIDESLE